MVLYTAGINVSVDLFFKILKEPLQVHRSTNPNFYTSSIWQNPQHLQIQTPLQFNWVCDDSWKPQTTQSIYFAGAIIGTLGSGWMMDHYGRVWTIKIATVNILITGFATPFVNGFFMFSVLRFLMGLSYPTFFHCTLMLSKLYLSTWFTGCPID